MWPFKKKKKPKFINTSMIELELYNRFNNNLKNAFVNFGDSMVRIITMSELERFLVRDWTDTYDYVKDKRDCTGFTRVMIGELQKKFGSNNIGTIVWENNKMRHRQLIFFDFPTNEFSLIEPQTDSITSMEDFKGDILLIDW